MSSAISREKRRLAAIFERAILVAIATADVCFVSVAACNSSSDNGDPPVVTPSGDAGGGDAIAPQTPENDGGADSSVVVVDKCALTPFSPPEVDTCGDYVRFPCGLPEAVVPRGDCFLTLGDCQEICPDIHFNCHLADGYCDDAGVPVVDDGGGMVIDCTTCPGAVGRVPSGLLPVTASSSSSFAPPNAVAAYWMKAAHLEAASVYAFRQLRRDLEELGAPADLIAAARDAERDEARHARAVGKLARQSGGKYIRPSVSPPPVQAHSQSHSHSHLVLCEAIEKLAIENMVEGCIRETYGALVAKWQSARARDEQTRRTLRVIADDELQHASLSWAITRWSVPLLDKAARDRLELACTQAIANLDRDDDDARDTSLIAAAGLPNRDESIALRSELARTIWSSLAA